VHLGRLGLEDGVDDGRRGLVQHEGRVRSVDEAEAREDGRLDLGRQRQVVDADEGAVGELGDRVGREGVDARLDRCEQGDEVRAGVGACRKRAGRTGLLLADSIKVAVLAQEGRHVAQDGERAHLDRLGRVRVHELVRLLLQALCEHSIESARCR